MSVELIDTKEIEGLSLHAWTLGDTEKLAPIFERIYQAANSKKIDMKKLGAFNLAEITKLIPAIIPEVSLVIEISSGVPAADACSFSLRKATIVLVTILTQNLDYIKNSFAPIGEALQAIAKG